MALEKDPQSTPDTNIASLLLKKYITSPRENYHFYQNRDFSSPVDAEKYLISDDFLKFWNKNNVSKEGIGYRVKTGWNALDSADQKLTSHGRRDYKTTIGKREATINRAIANFKPNPYKQRPVMLNGVHQVGEDGRLLFSVVPDEVQKAHYLENMNNGLNQIRTLSRIENRFHTSYPNVIHHLDDPEKGLSAYLQFALSGQRSGHAGAGETTFPVKMLMDENLPRYSLAGYQPFDGQFKGIDVHKAMEALDIHGGNAHKRYGTRLGASVSSSPKNEVFVPVGMAQKARRVANVLPDKTPTIRVAGPPDKAANALRFAGNVGRAAKPVMGVLNAALTPLQIADQIIDANSDDQMIANYRGSDPFSLRPWMDVALDSYTDGIGPALEKYRRVVNDPRYIEMNPISSIGGQAVRGNPEYLKAFLNNLGYYGNGGGWFE